MRVLEAALFYGRIFTALSSFELPSRQAQGFGRVQACGGPWSLRTGLKVCLNGLGLGALKLGYDWMAKEAMTPCAKQTGPLVRAAGTKLQLLCADKDDWRGA